MAQAQAQFFWQTKQAMVLRTATLVLKHVLLDSVERQSSSRQYRRIVVKPELYFPSFVKVEG